MSLSGFKCYGEQTILDFGNPTVITGGNGRGKSSIADAIAFAITGLPFYGERGIDRLYTDDGTTELRVSMCFTDEAGVSHQLTRTRVKSRMSITYDGYDIRQVDLTDMFGEKDVFLSIFNPLYFIEELGDDGKALLERYLPTISHEEVLEGLGERTREALKNEPLLSPDTYLKRRREEIRDLEQTIIYLTGQKDLTIRNSEEGQSKCQELRNKIAVLSAEEVELRAKQFISMDVTSMQEQLVELSARYDELASDSAVRNTDNRLMELQHQLGQRRGAVYVPKYATHIAEVSSKVKALSLQYKQEVARGQSFVVGTPCPTCKRAVGEGDLSAIHGAFQQSVSAIIAQGKEQKAQLDELTALEKQTTETFQKFQIEDIQKLEAEIAALLVASESSGDDNGAGELRQKIQSLTADLEYGDLTHDEYQRLLDCCEEKQLYEAELTALQGMVSEPVEDFDGKIKEIETQITEKKRLLADVALYVSHRAELTFSKLKMNRVAIALYDVVKSTGEVKDVFRFTYNGRLYNRLSLSEKIRAGMEVSELMKRLTGRNYPVFTDNMESVDDLHNIRPTGQIFMAKCVKDAPLAIKAMGVQTQSQAA